MKLLQLVWPHFARETNDEKNNDRIELQKLIDEVEKADWSTDIDHAVQAAKDLFNAERDRRKTAENKATIQLTILSASIPFVLYISNSTFTDHNNSHIFNFSITYFIFISICYTIAGAYYATKSLNISISHRVDAPELIECWQQKSPKEELTKLLIKCSIHDRRIVNDKLSNIKLSQKFLFRACGMYFLTIIAKLLA